MADADKADAEKTGAEKTGAEKTGAEKADAGNAGAGNAGAEKADAGKSGAENAGTENAGAGDAPEAKPRSRSRSKAAEGSAESTAGDNAAAESTAAESTASGTAASGSSASKGSTSRTSASRTSASRTSGSRTSGSRASGSGGASKSAAAGKPAREPAGPAGRARLKLHHLRPAPGAHRDKTRVGRGEASKGKTAGRGTKGTKARGTVPARFEGGQMPIHRRLPKLKGFSNSGFKTTYQVVNLDRLTALYPSGGAVTPDDLVARGAVRKGQPVKILGTGEAGAKLQVTAHAFSGSAREKITAAGGSVTEL